MAEESLKTEKTEFTFRNRELILGIGLFLLGLLLPLFLTVGQFRIYETLAQSLRSGDVVQLILTVLKLVGLNIVRSVPDRKSTRLNSSHL